MKKIIYILTVMVTGLFFTGCDPMEDVYNELDQLPSANDKIVGDITFTLTDDDYDDLNLNFGNFSSTDEAKSLIPGLLTDKFPTWGVTYNDETGKVETASSALVGYELYRGNAFGAKDYTLNQDDYTFSGSDLLGFQSNATPSNYLADILANNAGSADEGDYRVAKYFQYTGSAFIISPKVSLENNLDYGATAGILTTISGGNWAHHSGADDQLAYSTESLSMANYPSSNVGGSMVISSSGSEDVNTNFSSIITSGKVYSSALMNLSTVGDGTYFFHLMEEDGSFSYSARVGAKSDGAGKILFGIGASSSSLTYGTTPFDLDTTYLIVASYDTATGTSNLYVLTSAGGSEPTTPESTNSGNSGNSAQRIGIRQGGGGPTAVIDGIRAANSWSAIMSNDALDDEVIGDKIALETGYTYTDGVWEEPSDRFYLVSDEDFDSMGEDSGQPGRFNNFGSSTPADDYLPTFLGLKFPYAPEGHELDVVYDYFSSSSGAQVRGNLYTKTNGVWMGYESTFSTTLQFGHNGTTWLPDNTIKLTVGSAEIAIIEDALGSTYPGPTSNVANFGSFDFRESSSNYWSPTMLLEAFNALLDNINSGAQEGQKYVLTIVIYDGSTSERVYSLIKTSGEWVLN